jgi:glycosyltransferase involved in cell wall biosynthesis
VRVVQISSSDNKGSRFNGLSIRQRLADLGIASTHLVWEKNLNDPETELLFPVRGSRTLNRKLAQIEKNRSLHSILQLQSFGLPLHKAFRSADVVHYHLIHDSYFSILALPFLSKLKPTVWTWHDPWMMTGHCIYPFDCQRWLIGCGSCPALSIPFPMKQDRTAEMFQKKMRIMNRASIDVVVASRWMRDMVQKSPIGKNVRTHHIPFGIDLEQYRPRDAKAARKRLGVFDDHFVIFVRATVNPFKGINDFINAIESLETNRKICIVAVQETGLLNRFIGKHQIIEFNWVNDDATMIDVYTAADLFVMPSRAEAFGLMAVEAMACGRPVIVCEGTSLPEVTFAPQTGVAVPQNNVRALAAAIKRLMEHPEERKLRGEKGRELAVRHYDIQVNAACMADLYRTVASREHVRAVRPSEA